MKKFYSAVLLVLMISTASFSREFVAHGKTHSSFGDYTVELTDDPVVLDGKTLNTFVINYQNSPLVVKVAVVKDEKCKKYVVISDRLAVQYVCNDNYFGVEKLDSSYEAFATSEKDLNRNAYFHQKRITNGQNSDLENARLIAVFFPQLLNDAATV